MLSRSRYHWHKYAVITSRQRSFLHKLAVMSSTRIYWLHRLVVMLSRRNYYWHRQAIMSSPQSAPVDVKFIVNTGMPYYRHARVIVGTGIPSYRHVNVMSLYIGCISYISYWCHRYAVMSSRPSFLWHRYAVMLSIQAYYWRRCFVMSSCQSSTVAEIMLPWNVHGWLLIEAQGLLWITGLERWCCCCKQWFCFPNRIEYLCDTMILVNVMFDNKNNQYPRWTKRCIDKQKKTAGCEVWKVPVAGTRGHIWNTEVGNGTLGSLQAFASTLFDVPYLKLIHLAG